MFMYLYGEDVSPFLEMFPFLDCNSQNYLLVGVFGEL